MHDPLPLTQRLLDPMWWWMPEQPWRNNEASYGVWPCACGEGVSVCEHKGMGCYLRCRSVSASMWCRVVCESWQFRESKTPEVNATDWVRFKRVLL